jgi:hypothetical protein
MDAMVGVGGSVCVEGYESTCTPYDPERHGSCCAGGYAPDFYRAIAGSGSENSVGGEGR